MEGSSKVQSYFFLVLFVAALLVMYLIFRPFLTPLVLALVLAVVLSPLNEYIRARLSNKSLALVLTITLVLVLILAPLFAIGILLFNEARDLYVKIGENGGAYGALSAIINSIEKIAPTIQIDINSYLQDILSYTVGHLGMLFSGFFKVILGVVLMVVSLFFLFRDGAELRNAYVSLSPLTNAFDEAILSRLGKTINSVIKGSLTIAIIQGILTAVGFAIFNIPNPVLWGTIASIASLIPGLGTALVIGPGVLYLFYVGSPFMAIGLILWGTLAVGLIDNFLSPFLIRRGGVKVHPLFILLSVLGGIALFGPVGFVLGPITLAFFFALLDIYPLIINNKTV